MPSLIVSEESGLSCWCTADTTPTLWYQSLRPRKQRRDTSHLHTIYTLCTRWYIFVYGSYTRWFSTVNAIVLAAWLILHCTYPFLCPLLCFSSFTYRVLTYTSLAFFIPSTLQAFFFISCHLRCHFAQGRRSHRIIGGHKRRLAVWGTEVHQWDPGAKPRYGVYGGRSPPETEAFLWNYT